MEVYLKCFLIEISSDFVLQICDSIQNQFDFSLNA